MRDTNQKKVVKFTEKKRNELKRKKREKNREIDFSFDSALLASVIKIGTILNEGKALRILTWDRAYIMCM